MRFLTFLTGLCLILLASGVAAAQPEQSPDGKVVFKIKAPKAQEVLLRGDWMDGGKGVPLSKNEQGEWSIAVEGMEPDLWSYNFFVDGVKTVDPANALMKGGARYLDSAVDVKGPAAEFQALRDVPHGTVTAHWYLSKATGKIRRVHIYTPPGYDAKAKKKYPVLYLLHGSGDSDREWSAWGRANWIIDNLLADRKAKPMIVVMPDGHPVTGTDKEARARASQVFMEDLIGSVMPLAETAYKVDARREMRALAGLSMGGGQTLYVGLRNLDKFASLGVFSMGIRNADFEKEHAAVFSDPAKTNRQLKVFQVMCGKADFLYKSAVALHETLDKGGIKHTWVESAGGHIWPNWRRYLRDFAPLLF